MVRGTCRRRIAERSVAAGQSLVEFALVVPVFLLLMMGVLEYGFLYNNILTVQYAARQGVSAAAQAGGVDGADCSILKAVERALTAPIDKTRLSSVLIFKSDANGDPVPGVANQYVRTGTLDCPGSGTEPYTLVGSEGYAQADRRDALADGLDVVGVRIGYLYSGITPIGAGRTWAVSDGASLRMEPKQ
ncbi:MAG: pilus assembly protein [Chloroflexota bacterium]|nr:pilus assembly protein [Chloroflexota bacterium]